MDIKIAPQKVEKKKFIHNPKVEVSLVPKLDVLRIESDDELTRIDFFYRNHFDYDGWVHIYRNSFIRIIGSGKELELVKAVNIPLAPTKYYFKKRKMSNSLMISLVCATFFVL